MGVVGPSSCSAYHSNPPQGKDCIVYIYLHLFTSISIYSLHWFSPKKKKTIALFLFPRFPSLFFSRFPGKNVKHRKRCMTNVTKQVILEMMQQVHHLLEHQTANRRIFQKRAWKPLIQTSQSGWCRLPWELMRLKSSKNTDKGIFSVLSIITHPKRVLQSGSCFRAVVRSETGLSGSPGTRPTWPKWEYCWAFITCLLEWPANSSCLHLFARFRTSSQIQHIAFCIHPTSATLDRWPDPNRMKNCQSHLHRFAPSVPQGWPKQNSQAEKTTPIIRTVFLKNVTHIISYLPPNASCHFSLLASLH